MVNPAAGAGRARRLWPHLRDTLSRISFVFDTAETRGPGHATSLAAEATR
ncbi:MAG: diacylglycerol kinase family protein, partial [Candidatus Rokuibacteriota bacterium]